MGDDLFKSGSPVVVLKDKARHSERRDFYCHCFLAAMLSDPQALNVVFEGGRGRENAKLNGTHTTVSPFATAKVNHATSEASEHHAYSPLHSHTPSESRQRFRWTAASNLCALSMKVVLAMLLSTRMGCTWLLPVVK